MKRISLEEVTKKISEKDYKSQYHYVLQLIESGCLKPVKASGTNGKKPALYREYWVIEQEDAAKRERLLEKLEYRLHPAISREYYRKHPDGYKEDRHWVLLLSNFLKEHGENLRGTVSCNERSFEIWQREKFLLKEQGKKILSRCGFTMDDINVYETAEPFSYYVNTRQVPQKLLILENKDTFYSMRKSLLGDKKDILGVEIGTLIYGAGKGIWRSFQEFDSCAEPYMKDRNNALLYFGDLDYEGIFIYEKLAEIFAERAEIKPFTIAYEQMLIKSSKLPLLPEMKEGQNQHISGQFFRFFSKETSDEMMKLLETGRYIPQEILNIRDF